MHRKDDIEAARQRLFEGIGTPPVCDFVADDFQREAIESVAGGIDTLVVAPTGSGKTFIAIQAIEATIGMGARAIYTTPLKALSNTKYADFKKRFEPEHKVGLLTGDRKIDGNASVVVATTEIYRNEIYKASDGYGMVVLDEVHFISDPQRGPVWEESIILTPSTSTLLMLSASISNAAEVAMWIQEVRGKECRVVSKRERPVELRLGFLDPELGPLPLHNKDGSIFGPVTHPYSQSKLDSSGMRLQRSGGDNRRSDSFRRKGKGGQRR